MKPLPKLERGPKLLREWYNEEIRPWLLSIQPLRSETCEIHETPSGCQIRPRVPGATSGGGGIALHPFQVVTRKNDNDTWSAAVYQGQLYDGLVPDSGLTITGLTLFSDAEPAWFNLDPTDVIWLTVMVDRDGFVTSATINSYGQSDDFDYTSAPWSASNSVVEDDADADDPRHQVSRIPLAFFFPDGNGAPVLSDAGGAIVRTQNVRTNLMMWPVVIDARPARYPVPA